jgi:hypothetical protein
MSAVIIIAGGPSLTKADVELCEKSGLPMMGINNAYLITDKLKYHYACDTKWWKWAYSAGEDAPPYPPQDYTKKFSLQREFNPKSREKNIDPGWPGVFQMRMAERQGLSTTWPYVCWGGNSGYQAINLAYLLGYKRIILLGYDMKPNGKQSHWHKDHIFSGSTNPCKGTFIRWLMDFQALAGSINKTDATVVNATRSTALDCFPKMPLEDALWQQ